MFFKDDKIIGGKIFLNELVLLCEDSGYYILYVASWCVKHNFPETGSPEPFDEAFRMRWDHLITPTSPPSL